MAEMFYFDIIKEFFDNGIDYLIVGGLAVNLHGIPRTTQDIDIIIALSKENILKMNHVLNKLGYVPRQPVDPDNLADEKTRKEWIEEKNLKAFSFYHKDKNYRVIDIVLVSPISFTHAEKNKIILAADNISIPVIGIDDLISMKKSSGRKQDISDIKLLKTLKKINEK
jgi:hypothetical protein